MISAVLMTFSILFKQKKRYVVDGEIYVNNFEDTATLHEDLYFY